MGMSLGNALSNGQHVLDKEEQSWRQEGVYKFYQNPIKNSHFKQKFSQIWENILNVKRRFGKEYWKYQNIHTLRNGCNRHDHRRRQGGGHRERPPARNGKNCCRKMMLFPRALFIATTFPKIVKNSIFRLNFYQKFLKISQQV